MENSVCKISWKLIKNWRWNRQNSSTTVNVNPGIVAWAVDVLTTIKGLGPEPEGGGGEVSGNNGDATQSQVRTIFSNLVPSCE